jgi:hypothetical protein
LIFIRRKGNCVSLPTPSPDALQRLRDELRRLLARRDNPSLDNIVAGLKAGGTQWSRATVGRILKCERLPSRDQLLAVVEVLKGDRAVFLRLWNDIAGVTAEPTEPTVQPGQCEGHLNSPASGDVIGKRIRVTGVVQAIPPQHHVWIAHQVDPGGLFWAKDFEVALDDEGHFERYVYEGGSAEEFSVLLLLVSEAGHNQLVNWMADGRFPGIPPNRNRFHELDRVQVGFDPTKS